MMNRIFATLNNHKYAVATAAVAPVSVIAATPALAADGTATLSGTLAIFTEVFQWFLTSGGELLSWMLDKPIILCSLAVFFVGAVVGMLSRIYNAF